MPAPAPAPPARDQTDGSWPSVSVVVVNYDGREYLDRCLSSLRALAYPADEVEIILIDNGSTDGSVEYVRSAFPEVQVVVNDTNTGFAPAVNQGARLANGTYLALINNDAEADPSWLRAAVHELESEPSVACVASKILREDRRTVDFAGGQLAFYGHGFARGVYGVDVDDGRNRDTLFASGGAMVVRTETFLEVGGFDDTYFAFFEDVDFGWRLNILGFRVRFVPGSRVYHRHHGTIERFGFAREAYLLERNALATIFKNYSDEQLARILPTSLILTVFRGIDIEGFSLPDYRITDGAEPLGDLTVPARMGAHLAAVRDFALSLDELRTKRTLIQEERTVSDRAVMRLFEESLRPNVTEPDFLSAFTQLVAAFDLNDHARPRSKVLIVTTEHLGERMTGGGVRVWEMAHMLAHEHEVLVASTEKPQRTAAAFQVAEASVSVVDDALAEADVVICHGVVMDRFPQIESCALPIVVDVSDPAHLDALGQGRGGAGVQRSAAAQSQLDLLNSHLERADFVVCASVKQRDFWLGQLASIGRINPATFDADSSLRSLLAVVPTGVPLDPPARPAPDEQAPPAIKGVVDGIGPDDFLLLWSGGISDGLDPLTLIDAVAQVADTHDDVKLCFVGITEPGAEPSPMGTAALKRAEELDVAGTAVHFRQDRVPYDERQGPLLDADVGVSTHLEHVETAMGFRNRFADYMWAGLPVITTAGDALTDPIREHGLGLTVPPGDTDALAQAIVRLRNDADLRRTCAANATEYARGITWDLALAPVSQFCRYPHRAPDKTGVAATYIANRSLLVTKSKRYYVGRFFEYVRAVGPRVALIHARNYARQRLARR
jgi:GT2 family glycosyltransferase